MKANRWFKLSSKPEQGNALKFIQDNLDQTVALSEYKQKKIEKRLNKK